MEKLKKWMDISFLVTMALYVLMGAAIVVIQGAALLTKNAELCLWAKDTLLTPACAVCGCTSLIAFGMSYLYKWKTT